MTPPPAFRRIAPKPPSWLGREAAAEWRRVVPELQRLDLTKEGDRGSLTLMCEAWETFVTATRAIRDGDGLVQELSNGRKLANPLVAIAREASREYRSWAVHFGLTPSAEQALGHAAPDDDPDNPFA